MKEYALTASDGNTGCILARMKGKKALCEHRPTPRDMYPFTGARAGGALAEMGRAHIVFLAEAVERLPISALFLSSQPAQDVP